MRRNRASARGAIETRIRKRRQSPFRFLDLPAEIRQMIYSEALCTFQPNVSFAVNARLRGIVYGKRDGWPTKPNIMVQNVNTSLLRTCRFIHEEAFDFMIKTNRYIRISSNDVDLDIPLFEAHIPVLSLSMHRVSQFPGHIMHVQIEDMGRGPRHGHRLRKRSKVKHSTELLLHISVLPAFCAALGWATFLQQRLKLSITIGDEMNSLGYRVRDWSKFCSPAIVQSLLDPFHLRAWGFEIAEMNVPHHIAMDPPLVQSLTKDDPWADDDSCILAAKEEVEAIDALMANSSFIDASERCAEAENIVSHYEEGTPGFSYVNVSKFSLFLAELSFRDAQCYEKITRLPLIRTPPDAEIIYELFNWMFRSCMRAIKNCQRAEASSRAGELMAEIKVFMKEVFVETDDSGDDSGDDSVHEISSPGLYWW